MAFDYIDYMRDVAERLKEIQHSEAEKRFHRISGIFGLEEMLSNIINMEGFQVMVNDTLEGRFISTDSALIDNPSFIFYVIHDLETNDFDTREITLGLCREIIKKIISKIYHDKETDSRNQTTYGLNYFRPETLRYTTVGPFGSKFYGIQVTFNIFEKGYVVYSDNDWIIES